MILNLYVLAGKKTFVSLKLEGQSSQRYYTINTTRSYGNICHHLSFSQIEHAITSNSLDAQADETIVNGR